MRLCSAFVCISLSVTATLTAASAARATIEIDKGIAGIEIGMTKAQVTSILGQPTKTKQSGEPDVDPGVVSEMEYPNKLTVTFVQNDPGVYGVATRSKREKTGSGLGVGSTEKAIRSKIKGVHCEPFGKARLCLTGKRRVGHRITEFQLLRGKVAKVSVYVQTP